MAFANRKRYEKGDLTKLAGITHNIVARMEKDIYVDLNSLEKIYLPLDCNIEYVVNILPDELENEKIFKYLGD